MKNEIYNNDLFSFIAFIFFNIGRHVIDYIVFEYNYHRNRGMKQKYNYNAFGPIRCIRSRRVLGGLGVDGRVVDKELQ